MNIKKITSFFVSYYFVYSVQVILFVLMILGVLPRNFVFILAALQMAYVLFKPIPKALAFFISSVPLFIALPLTGSFDSLNIWRLLSIAIFIRWTIKNRMELIGATEDTLSKLIKKPLQLILDHKIAASIIILFIISAISITAATEPVQSIKRIIYFINLLLVPIVIYDQIKRNALPIENIIKPIATATILAVVAGFAQLLSTYLVDIYKFMNIWGERIQFIQFGRLWSDIAVYKGNTWLAYYGDQLTLRMFSLFPDSHSFPIYIILGMASIITLALKKIDFNSGGFRNVIKSKIGVLSIVIPCVILAAFLSGTRGIWVAGAVVIIGAIIFLFVLVKRKIDKQRVRVFEYVGLLMIFFVLAYLIAQPIFASPQFMASKDSSFLNSRLRSIIDFGETSNAQRIAIYKATLKSITKHPLLGVGIYNFPVVLDQKVILSRAGSSAHNIYLHIAAEMGIPALVIFLAFVYLLISKTYGNFSRSNDKFIIILNASLLICLSWVLIYSLTDVALFDERAFLMFSSICAIIFGTNSGTLTSYG
ncbi:MAG: O-antigen polymerase [Parcubacteria group bacterium Licking1014_17]|nr:MAG: O-antigen polymerase [Parcubacteria group bacterium Licking1014_17]